MSDMCCESEKLAMSREIELLQRDNERLREAAGLHYDRGYLSGLRAGYAFGCDGDHDQYALSKARYGESVVDGHKALSPIEAASES